MRSIALVKPYMSALGHGKLSVSPFGLLAQAFTEEILSHAESAEGMYRMYDLELLQEGDTAQESAAAPIQLKVDLKLILQQLKENGKMPAAERIVEKAISTHLMHERTVVQRETKLQPLRLPSPQSGYHTAVTVPVGKRLPAPQQSHREAFGSVSARAGRLGQAGYPAHSAASYSGGKYGAVSPAKAAPMMGAALQRPKAYLHVARMPYSADMTFYADKSYQPVSGTYQQRALRQEPLGSRPMLFSELLRQAQSGESFSPYSAQKLNNAGNTRAVKYGMIERIENTPPIPTGRADTRADFDLYTPQDNAAQQTAQPDRYDPQRQLQKAAADTAEALAKALNKQGVHHDADQHRAEPTREDTQKKSPDNTNNISRQQLSASDTEYYGAKQPMPLSRKDINHTAGFAQQTAQPAALAQPAYKGFLPLELEHAKEPAETAAEQPISAESGAVAKGIEHAAKQLGDTIAKASSSLSANREKKSPSSNSTDGKSELPKSQPRQMQAAADLHEPKPAQTDTEIFEAAAEQMKMAARSAESILPPPPLTLEYSNEPQPVEQSAAQTGKAQQALTAEALEKVLTSQQIKTLKKDITTLANEPQITSRQSGDAARRAEINTPLNAAAENAKQQLPTPPPLTLEYSNEPQPVEQSAAQTGKAQQALTAEALGKILTSPQIKTLNKDITTLAGEPPTAQPKSRQSSDAAHKASINTPLSAAAESAKQQLPPPPPLSLEYSNEPQPVELPTEQKGKTQETLTAEALGKILTSPQIKTLNKAITTLAAEPPTAQPKSRRSGEAAHTTAIKTPVIAAPESAKQQIPPPLTLEYSQSPQSSEISGAVSADTLEKLNSTPGIRLLHKDIAALAAKLTSTKPSTSKIKNPAAIADTAKAKTGLKNTAPKHTPMHTLSQTLSGKKQAGFSAAEAAALPPPMELAHMEAGHLAAEGENAFGQKMTANPQSYPDNRQTSANAPHDTAKAGEYVLRQQTAYPALRMEYGNAFTALARDLRQTKELGIRTSAARSMEEKAEKEPMQTLDLMSQPIMEEQVVWQNPYMSAGPTQMTYKQKPAAQQRQNAQQVRISDAEIRRTADKVFKLVQEKIISERRRSGRM